MHGVGIPYFRSNSNFMGISTLPSFYSKIHKNVYLNSNISDLLQIVSKDYCL